MRYSSHRTGEAINSQAHRETGDAGHYGDIGYADYFMKASIEGYYGNTSDLLKPTKEQNAIRCTLTRVGALSVELTDLCPPDESLSEQFFDQMQPITAEKPWMVTPGNHEANCDNGLKGYGVSLAGSDQRGRDR